MCVVFMDNTFISNWSISLFISVFISNLCLCRERTNRCDFHGIPLGNLGDERERETVA